MSDVQLIVPASINDPTRPSGGNLYDRQVGRGLTALGWAVHERAVPGAWPDPDEGARAAFADALASSPDAAVVVVDGLIASTAPELLGKEAQRLRLVVLMHMPLGAGTADVAVRTREGAALRAVAAVVATSEWSRRWLVDAYAVPPEVVHVAPPGVAAADIVTGSPSGERLLCVAAVTPGKGHDVLFCALAEQIDLPWRCVCVGSQELAPDHARAQLERAEQVDLRGRIRFTGPLDGVELDAAFGAADVLVLPSRAETYAMVVTEALARGLPVIATDVGGLPEALGTTTGHGLPGLLVRPNDPRALATALRRWLVDAELRQQLRAAALLRRATLTDWSTTAEQLSWVLKVTA